MSYVEYIKTSEIVDEEWEVLLNKPPREFIDETLNSLVKNNRFFGSELLLKLLYLYIVSIDFKSISTGSLNGGITLYRARIYAENDAQEKFKDNSRKKFKGYSREESFVAPVPAENRCSPKYIQCLYVSDKVDTCISEVCPMQDDFVSVADIKVNQRLELVNFDVSVSAAFRSNDKKAKWINHFIILLPQLFSKPVNEKDMKVYLLCQYISEFIKILGYDGIKYMSSKSDCGGANYSIFSFDKCEAVSSRLYKVSTIHYSTNKYEI